MPTSNGQVANWPQPRKSPPIVIGGIRTMLLATTVMAASLVAPVVASAQGQVDAVAVAASVQSFYNQTRGVSANFHQTYFTKLYGRYTRSRGQVLFVKPGKMRWDYARPNGKVIVSDGSHVIVYEPGDDGSSGQYFDQAMSEHELPQAFSFLTGSAQLADDFSFRLLDPQRQGYPDGYVLELRPRVATPHYERILFYVLKQGNRPAGVVRRVLIVDSAGNRNRFDFSDLAWNPSVPGNTFRFRPPAGAHRIEP